MGKNSITILIVDDEPEMRKALGELLAEEDYNLAFAESGAETLTKARDVMPDLILLDVMMLDMDGFATCQSLRADEILAQVPIIMVTAMGDRASLLRGFESGADDYVTKPIDQPELLARVHTTTRLNRYRKLLEEQTSRETAEKALQRSLEEIARSQQLLLALSQAAQAVQRARTPDEVYKTIGDEIVKLGYHALVFTLTEDNEHLVTRHVTFKPDLLQTAEKLLGFSAQGYRFPMKPGSIYQRILAKGVATFTTLDAKSIVDALSKAIHPLAGKLVDLLGLGKSIFAPLQVGSEMYGLMTVLSNDLQETDVPAITAFASQAAIAIENTRLYQTAQQERDKAQRYLDVTSVLFVALDTQGKIVLINRKGCDTLERKEEEILGKNWFNTCLPVQIRERVRPVFNQLIAGEIEPVEYYENPVLTKSGEERLIAWHNTVLRNEAGNIVGTLSSGEDITERKQAERALAETQALLKSVIEQSPVAMAIATPDGTITTYNDACLELLGIDDEPDLQAGSNLLKMRRTWQDYDVDDHPIPAEELPLALAIQGKTTLRKEMRCVRKDGTERWEIVDSAPIYDKDGKLIAGFVIFPDITEQKQAEEALRESEERHRTLFETMTQGVLYWNTEGKVIAANPAAERILGLTLDQLQGKAPVDPRWKLIHQDGAEVLGEALPAIAALRSGEEMHDATFMFFNPVLDSYHWINVNATPLLRPGEDTPHRAYTILEDITERVQAEAETKQRNQELAALNEIGQAIVSSLDLQKTLTIIADHTTRLMGMAATSVALVDEANDDLYFAAASGEGADFIVGQRLALGQGVAGWVVQRGEPVLIPDVTQDDRWYGDFDAEGGFSTRSILCVPLKSKGRIIGAIEAINKEYGFNKDDLHLLNALVAPVSTAIENARLFEQVRTGREQLRTLSRRLVEMQEAERAHVARELHDETGQALSSMLLNLGLLEQEADQPKMVIIRTNEMIMMVDDMLENLHRLAMNLRPATLDHLGLIPALEQYIETFNQQHRMKAQFEAVGLSQGRLPPEVETALYRIVQESLTNVVRHAQATQADVLVERRGDKVVTIIEDNGVGFDSESAMQTSRLGLLGMRERAEMLNGKLVIESSPGLGTTILVEVPYGNTATQF
jgi:PAS domain S-box-containing protein